MFNILKGKNDIFLVSPMRFTSSARVGFVLDIINMLALIIFVFVYIMQKYPIGIVFHNLVHLTICTCETAWLNLLICVLKDSPKLQGLRIEQVLLYIIKPNYIQVL